MTPPTLKVELVNQTSSSTVFAYITGLDIDRGNSWVIVKSDGNLYYPSSPSEILQPLGEECGISLGNPGSSRTVTIPHIAGGRIYFSVDKPLIFLLNPGPALVEPSPTNPSDPNYNTSWHFCEFTYNSAQLFANISYVDFVALPIALTLETTRGDTKRVPGSGPDALATVCSELEAQQAKDGAGWDSLIVRANDKPLRALSPNNGIVLNGALFENYWSRYVDEAWSKYANEVLIVDTQAAPGQVKGNVTGQELKFSAGSYAKPSARDIFSCSTGPFAGGSPEMLAITPRLAAAINRSTLHTHAMQPSAEATDLYYTHQVTNHYARIVHEVNLDKRGYAFPYDDVVPNGGSDVAGTFFDSEPELFRVTVGGKDGQC
ncbi:MAG: hypothetical protein LQ340_002603 [Diploschistes diacapsis]|nr:MAG: hypothetical protein LQ340_002603 [Diploschistes diacapsis]